MAEGRTAHRRVNQRSGRTVRAYANTGSERGSGYRTSARTGAAGSERARREREKTLERNRARETGVGRGYVVFLALISLLTVLMCVSYLRLKATITSQNSTNEELESTLVSMKSENDALYENVNNDVDWAYIKDVAINELGMKYATEEQVVWYNTDVSSSIRQYEDVPAS